jgi:hypothetical protein
MLSHHFLATRFADEGIQRGTQDRGKRQGRSSRWPCSQGFFYHRNSCRCTARGQGLAAEWMRSYTRPRTRNKSLKWTTTRPESRRSGTVRRCCTHDLFRLLALNFYSCADPPPARCRILNSRRAALLCLWWGLLPRGSAACSPLPRRICWRIPKPRAMADPVVLPATPWPAVDCAAPPDRRVRFRCRAGAGLPTRAEYLDGRPDPRCAPHAVNCVGAAAT